MLLQHFSFDNNFLIYDITDCSCCLIPNPDLNLIAPGVTILQVIITGIIIYS